MLASLAADRAALADFQAKILDLQSESTVQERLDSYRYPVLTLPNEVVSEIFMRFIPAYPKWPPLRGLGSPITLTHICRKWRQTALATPTLWRALELKDGFDERAIWLDRAGSLPVSLVIDIAEESPSAALEVSKAFAFILPYCERWEYLFCRIHDGRALPVMEYQLPLLRGLQLEFTVEQDFVVGDAPLLRTAVLDYNAPKHVILPWARLTKLTLYCVTRDEAMPLLQSAPNLVYLVLSLYPDSKESADTRVLQDLTMPSLTTLVVNTGDRGLTTYVLPRFRAPALRVLDIYERLLGPNPIDSLTSFITKSGCNLRHLHLYTSRPESDSTYRIAFPSITKIVLTSV
ncbi:F-box domain-containing protein [Favolaschia claudopus]|uniref:F-box domain-containing protein n=1 Tax=Favolaschia claudopus TaxID=2862362 RepID=A0AAW0AZE4_9AGAR